MAVYLQYEKNVFREAGINGPDKLAGSILGKMQQFKFKHVLFDDVLPALSPLQEKGLLLGLISNVDHDMTPLFEELGLMKFLNVIVTSQEAGFNKPQPEIFQAALAKASVKAHEAIYVGDQYRVDALGARNAGMKGILIDRGNDYPQVTDCPRIHSLSDIINYL